MTSCELTPPVANKACSGKCLGKCPSPSSTWLVAACGGMISLFKKEANGNLVLLSPDGETIAPSIEDFALTMQHAAHNQDFNQLILAGSANDMAWVRIALPDNVAKSSVAELEYPLIPAWFKHAGDMSHLTHALENMLQD